MDQRFLCVLSAVLCNVVLSNPVKNFVVTKDSLSHDVLISTLPSIKLEKYGDRLYYFGAIFEVSQPIFVGEMDVMTTLPYNAKSLEKHTNPQGNYYRAMQFCKYHDMELLSIETKEENDFLWKHMQSFLGWGEYYFWTSGTTLPDDHWVWMSTGKPILFANWFPNQPDNAGNNEKCLEVRYSNHNKALMWNDHVCTESKHVICETTMPKSISMTIAAYPDSCNVTVLTVPTE